MKAIVAGASGLTGHAIIEELLREPRLSEVIAVVRKKSPGSLPSRLREVEFPLQPLEYSEEWVCFCSLGTTIKKAGSREEFRRIDHDLVVDFARTAKSLGAKTFALVSATGADPQSPIFYNRVKGEVENSLKELGFPHLVIARPGLLIGDRQEKRAGERFAIRLWKTLSRVIPDAFMGRAGTRVEALARALVREALSPQKAHVIFEPKDLI